MAFRVRLALGDLSHVELVSRRWPSSRAIPGLSLQPFEPPAARLLLRPRAADHQLATWRSPWTVGSTEDTSPSRRLPQERSCSRPVPRHRHRSPTPDKPLRWRLTPPFPSSTTTSR